MEFALSEEQALFRKSVRDFVEREVIPAAREIDEQDEFPWDLFRQCGRLGFFALRYPEAIGGLGADSLTFILMIEELARGSLALASIVGMQALNGTDILYHLGTQAQKQRWLIPAMSGEAIGTIAITEPDAGSDIAVRHRDGQPPGRRSHPHLRQLRLCHGIRRPALLSRRPFLALWSGHQRNLVEPDC